MWQLLKAEFSYYRYNLYFSVIAYILFICGYIVCLVVDSGFIRYHHIIIATWIPAIIATLSMLHSKNTAKRDRILAVLPISPVRIAYARLLFAVIVWLCLVTLFWIIPSGLKLVDIGPMTVYYMLFLNGNFLIINALYFISEDAKYCMKKKTIFYCVKTDAFLMIFFNALIILLWLFTFSFPYDFVFGIFESYVTPMNSVVFSAEGLLTFNVIGFGLSYLSIRTFIRRKTYIV